MKKLTIFVFMALLCCTLLAGCAGNYSPKQLGEYGEVYKSTDLDIDGSNSVINISKISKTSRSVIVDIGAPTADQIAWAYEKFMYFNLEDEKGNIKISLEKNSKGLIKLLIADNGIGLPSNVNIENPKDVGIILIKSLTEQIEGSIELLPLPGTAYEINFTD